MTTVIQSAFARHMLQNQLKVVALFNPEEPVTPGMNAAFNDIWANNGDAVRYHSTLVRHGVLY